MANLSHDLVFDRFATDATFRKRLWVAFKIWVFAKIQDQAMAPWKDNFIDLYSKLLITPMDVNDETQQKLQRLCSSEASFWDSAITDAQIFAGFEFIGLQVLFAFGYVDSPYPT